MDFLNSNKKLGESLESFLPESYEETMEWLYSRLPMFSRIGGPAYKPGLQTTHTLDKLYDHPHRKFRSIHVGGTNGKGSTSHMIASVLQAQGYKTGLYTSPHLTDFRERMRVNGEMIPKEEVMNFVNSYISNIEFNGKTTSLRPSFFELTMMMAFDWFAREEVDYAVIEVGMGGRLDSTNIITPILSIITNISFDHTQFLGSTLEAIAGEKAGIIKPDIPVVIGEASGSVRDVFIAKAAMVKAPITFASTNTSTIEKSEEGFVIDCDFEKHINTSLAGDYQENNIRTVLTALNILREEGIALSGGAVKSGLENVCGLTGLRGRWQKISSSPVVICDTGHNLAGIKATMNSLRARYSTQKVHFVIGFVNDKDVSHIVDLFPKDSKYYFTQASIPRAMPVREVRRHFSSMNIQGEEFPTVSEAFRSAMGNAEENDIIYIGGSTFVVADFLAFYNPEGK